MNAEVSELLNIERYRSAFWIRIHKNDDAPYVILTNEYTLGIIRFFHPALANMSPKDWTLNKKNFYFLWIPQDRIIAEVIQDFIQWAEAANNYIWLKPNSNTQSYFVDELDYCVAVDWNMFFDTKPQTRTEIGEAEYQIKYRYPRGEISREQAEDYKKVLFESMIQCITYLPISNPSSVFVTSIPANLQGNRLPWDMVEYVSNKLEAKPLKACLVTKNQYIKNLPVNQKIEMWGELYKNNAVDLSEKIKGRKILVVDDLYQSGVSIWSFAKYLKLLGASKVFGLVAVKSQRDSDNR